MNYTPKEHLIIMLYIALAAAIISTGIYFIGHAVHDSDDQRHKQQLECIQTGGHMDRAPQNSAAMICTK